jgi:mRNA-degrading endonuclease RelE of RelBE toxin-antitoxin system
MAILMMHSEVLKRFHKLPAKVQKRVPELIDKFQNNPYDPAVGLHGLKETMLDAKVRGADLPDGYRAIIIAPEKGDTFLLVYIDSHDRAYDWAKNKRFEVHTSTGAFQLFDVQLTTQVLQETVSKQEETYPLQALSDDELYHAGVPKQLIPSVRLVKTDEELELLGEYLPTECYEVLCGVAAGLPLDEALAHALGSIDEKVAVAGPGDFSLLAARANRDLVIVEGEEDLKAMLSGGSLEEWRVFLHPKQRKIVEFRTNGPMSITGAAGTGKTVALMHRAVYLAKHLQNSKEKSKDKILLITFTTNLSVTIKSYIRRLNPVAAEKIDVTNLNQLARTICNRGGWSGRIATPEEINDLWDEVWADATVTDLPMSKLELQKEFDLVVDAYGIETEEAYLTAVRTGRPRMGRKQRRDAWAVFQVFRRLLLKRNLLTFEGAIHQARFVVEQGNFPTFRHVLADEVQDFSLEALKLIGALSPIKQELTNPLCVAGDAHQRIYRTKVPLSFAGINVKGRSRQLKVNYRTSQQIRRFAQSILEGVQIDDLDDGQSTTVGDISAFTGPEPDIIYCINENEEAKQIATWIKQLIEQDGFADHEICVTPYRKETRTILEAEGIKTYELKPREEDPGAEEPGVRLGTMKRIKGLEFRAIVMACQNQTDAMNNLDTSELLERCERYVAATRARERLMICVSKK